jgi:hypothetical protein
MPFLRQQLGQPSQLPTVDPVSEEAFTYLGGRVPAKLIGVDDEHRDLVAETFGVQRDSVVSDLPEDLDGGWKLKRSPTVVQLRSHAQRFRDFGPHGELRFRNLVVNETNFVKTVPEDLHRAVVVNETNFVETAPEDLHRAVLTDGKELWKEADVPRLFGIKAGRRTAKYGASGNNTHFGVSFWAMPRGVHALPVEASAGQALRCHVLKADIQLPSTFLVVEDGVTGNDDTSFTHYSLVPNGEFTVKELHRALCALGTLMEECASCSP